MINLKRPLIVFDLETTGLNTSIDRVIELGALVIDVHGNSVTHQSYINPEMDIPEESTAINGITNEMVKDAPTFKELSEELYELFNDADLCGYNSNKFDIPMLLAEFKRAGLNYDITNRALIDACHIFRTKERRTLEGAYWFYCNKSLKNSHSAVHDLMATWEVLQAQVSKYDDLTMDIEVLHNASNDSDSVDLEGKIKIDKKGFEIINFGKHRGKRICDLFIESPSYFDWILSTDFNDDTKTHLKRIIDKLK